MSEMRTMSGDGKNTAAKSGKAGDGTGDDGAPKAKGKKKLVMVAAGVLLAGAGAGGYLVLGPGKPAEAAEAEKEPEVELGTVLTVDPISINLADGHYLKLGLGLQAIADVAHEPDGAVALDAAISLYSGRSMAELGDPASRDALKEELKHSVEEHYHGDVVDVYFTEYVMQ